MGCIKEKFRSIMDLTSEDYFFKPKSSLLHQESHLKDSVRMKAYMDGILQNQALFKDKVVLDVCCGTGILSLFAACAGAAKVLAIDENSILEYTEKIVKDNGLENIISVVFADICNLDVLPGNITKVDIILCDWIGDCLINDSHLDSLLYARNRWLVDGGSIFPDLAGLYITAIEDTDKVEAKIDWWRNVYGFDMSDIRNAALGKPAIENVNTDQVVSNACLVKEMDVMEVNEEDLNFEFSFLLEMKRDDYVHALLLYFDIHLTSGKFKVGFSSGPGHPKTFWKQTKFYLDEELLVSEGDELAGLIRMHRRADSPSKYNVELELKLRGKFPKDIQKSKYVLP